MKRFIAIFLCTVLLLTACICGAAASTKQNSLVVGTSGTIRLTNYNIDGLPIPAAYTEDGEKDAYENTLIIGQIMNLAANVDGNTSSYPTDILAVQEDFNYDSYFRALLTNYTYQSDHSGGVPLGDGLNVFTTSYEMTNTIRVTWNDSNGVVDDYNDELTNKGFMVTTICLDEDNGIYIDLYNVHMDAGSSDDDVEARASQFDQLADFIEDYSANRPIIITGDFNSSLLGCDDEPALMEFIERLGLNDAWMVANGASYIADYLEDEDEDADTSAYDNADIEYHAYVYDEDTLTYVDNEEEPDYSLYYEYIEAYADTAWDDYYGLFDSIERYLYRDGGGVSLSIVYTAFDEYTTSEGNELSDHAFLYAYFTYTALVEPTTYGEIIEDEEETFFVTFLKWIASFFQALGKLLQEWFNIDFDL